uniref:Uncharacterized protein AlNc14C126G6816 n=1 Tax=Albugo laibachii Nc14 TaxID=890382 RepID=F0WJU6_9STRA|nr:conserved hypothetical protein [Albugo laibachii Nc14]|eukprot:CCA21548.1 conserved hypothetical protein [Albugo laibachii Nc14]
MASLLTLLLLAIFATTSSAIIRFIQNDSDFQVLQSDLKVHVLFIVSSASESEKTANIEQYVEEKHSAFVSLAKGLDGIAIFDVLDLSSASTATLKTVVSWNIPKLPGLIMFCEAPKKNPYTGSMYRKMEVLHADKALSSGIDDLEQRIKASIPALYITNITRQNDPLKSLEKIFIKAKHGINVVILVGRRRQIPHAYRALSIELRGQGLTFVYINSNEATEGETNEYDFKGLFAKLKVKKTPALVALKSFQDKGARWSKVSNEKLNSYKEMKSFLEPFCSEVVRPKASSRTSSGIQMLNTTTFEEYVLESTIIWVVYFGSKSDIDALSTSSDEWIKSQRKVNKKYGIISFGAVNCDENNQPLCEKYGGAGMHRVFPVGLEEKSNRMQPVLSRNVLEVLYLPHKYQTLEEAKKAAIESIPYAVEVLHSAMEISRFAEQAEINKALPVVFFTEKEKVPAIIRAVSVALRGHNVAFATAVEIDKADKAQYGISPKQEISLVCFVSNKTTDVDQPDSSGKTFLIGYDKKQSGAYNYFNLVRFLLSVLHTYPGYTNQFDEVEDTTVEDTSGVSLSDAVPYMTKENQKNLCSGSNICVIGFFQNHVDTLSDPESALSKYLDMFTKIAVSSKKQKEPFVFMWSNGKCQKDFAEAFEVGVYQMPTVAVYSVSKQRFATMIGVFEAENVQDFLKGVITGRIGTASIDNVPELRDDCSFDEIEAENVGVPEDDNEDLSDIMDEIIKAEKEQKRVLEEAQEQPKKRHRKGKGGRKKKRSKKASKDEL